MKRFQFHLAKVLAYRRQELEMEEVKLQLIFGQRQSLEVESARLENEAAETRRSLMVTGTAESQDLLALDSYLHHLGGAKKRHGVKIEDCQKLIAKQQQGIVEARRRVRLLEILEERKLRQWRTAIDREQENLSSELFLARWKRG